MTETSVRPTSRRRDRLAARRVLWAESGLERVRKCGAVVIGDVALKVSGAGATRTAGFTGLATCGSVWSCPVCSAKIAAHRQAEIQAATSAWEAVGGQVVFGTFTMQHRAGQSLRSLWDALNYAWSRVTSGRGWVEDQERFGIAGWLRVIEVTKGCNGWHVHIHTLLFVDRRNVPTLFDQDQDPLASLSAQLLARWQDSLRRKGFDASTARGVDLKVTRGTQGLGDYFAKSVYVARPKLGLEVARGDLKRGHVCPRGDEHRGLFTILADVVALGDADDLADWLEYERVSKGKRQMTWSKGLREQLLHGVEVGDQEIAESDHGGDVLLVVEGGQTAWRDLRWLHETALTVAESDDTGDAVKRWLLDAGFAYRC